VLTEAFVLAAVPGTAWGWVVWILIGGIAGWLASLLVEGTGLGLLGDIIVGIIGAFIGGIILGALGAGGTGIFWTFVTAFVGAVVLLLVIKLLMNAFGGGRRTPMRSRL
jgi:uncharacterized membrane protein YeaQ/YmgE (transglycosylase-associated protein family)